MKNKLIIIVLALLMANALILMGIMDNTLRKHTPVHCGYLYTDSEVKVCQ